MSQVVPAGGTSCHACGESASVTLATANANRHHTVVCTRCKLIYASPQPRAEVLESHYLHEFRGDAGGQVRAEQGALDQSAVQIEEARVRNWALPLVCRFVQLRGARILDLRCQSGALTAALAASGAEVLPIDPFEANLEYLAQQRGLSRSCRLSMSRFHELPGEENSLDAVTALNEHVPGHVLPIRPFLARLWSLLKPGGYAILDEKHVLKPTRFKLPSLLDTGHAHLYHFVPQSMRTMLESAGFEVVRCEVDPRRKSSFRHLNVVARKPESGEPNDVPPTLGTGPTMAEIRRALWWSQQRYRLTQARHAVKRGFSRRAA